MIAQGVSASGEAADKLLGLRQELGLAKVSLVVNQAADLLEAGESVVVFAHHIAVQTALAEALAEYGVARIAGGQSADDRQAAIDGFQAGDNRVAVVSITAGGVGITLNRANQVILAELPWTSAAQEQAIDRVHRIGQDSPVTAWRPIAAQSLDERMAATINAKASTAAQIVDGLDADDAHVPTLAEILLPLVMPVARRLAKTRKGEAKQAA